ncbi:hypothetical protein LEP3755_65710 (plasmid) [Leptolyngbya sp. NIES-3755]|nr:hypothetical protein LEP3755_65710 [Leptolyngbya sp. NIES-3755]
MASTSDLATLEAWLNQHSVGNQLASSRGGFTTVEEIRQLAESCDELEIEDDRVYLNWNRRESSPSGYRFQSIIAIPDAVNPRIQLKSTPLTFEEFMARSPGGLELCSGYLGSDIKEAFNLLDIALETFGLLQVVRRAPKELWEAALTRAYESGGQ